MIMKLLCLCLIAGTLGQDFVPLMGLIVLALTSYWFLAFAQVGCSSPPF